MDSRRGSWMEDKVSTTLCLDIELTPRKVYVWSGRNYEVDVIEEIDPWYMLCFSWQWLPGKTEVFSQRMGKRYRPGKLDDYEVVARLRELLDQADIVLTHNGKKFDIKKFNSRCLFHKIKPPSDFKQIDTYQLFKGNFAEDSNKLQEIAAKYGLGNKVVHNGFPLWKACMQGEEKAWRKMERYNCMTPDHKVLNKRLEWVEIGSLRIGDQILGFDEESTGFGRRYKTAIVEQCDRVVQPVYEVSLSNGDKLKTTAEHKWLAQKMSHGNGGGTYWIETQDLLFNGVSLSGKRGPNNAKHKSTRIAKPFSTWTKVDTNDAGWIAGMFDGEGSLHVPNHDKVCKDGRNMGGINISVSQKTGPESDRIGDLIRGLGFQYTFREVKPLYEKQIIKNKLAIGYHHITGTIPDKLRFLGMVRPERLISKVDFDRLCRVENRNEYVFVENVRYLGEREIIVLGTSSRTFVSDGYLMHNCRDVDLTVAAYELIREWINRPKTTYDNRLPCPHCDSQNTHRRGVEINSLGRWRKLQCRDCAKWFKGEKLIRKLS